MFIKLSSEMECYHFQLDLLAVPSIFGLYETQMNYWFDYYSCVCELVILTVAVYCEGIQSDVSFIIFQATFYEWVTEFKSIFSLIWLSRWYFCMCYQEWLWGLWNCKIVIIKLTGSWIYVDYIHSDRDTHLRMYTNMDWNDVGGRARDEENCYRCQCKSFRKIIWYEPQHFSFFKVWYSRHYENICVYIEVSGMFTLP